MGFHAGSTPDKSEILFFDGFFIYTIQGDGMTLSQEADSFQEVENL
jgi:hypothetical protein